MLAIKAVNSASMQQTMSDFAPDFLPTVAYRQRRKDNEHPNIHADSAVPNLGARFLKNFSGNNFGFNRSLQLRFPRERSRAADNSPL